MSALTTTSLVALFAISLAAIGPALDDIDAARTVAEELQAVPASVAARQRMETAAQAMCGGENAVAQWQADGSVVCRTKRGYTTQRLSVAQLQQGGRP
ncbi:MAG: hypothetical protein ACK5QH_08910 [Rubrivivax sp.]|jgi:hypothetical protein